MIQNHIAFMIISLQTKELNQFNVKLWQCYHLQAVMKSFMCIKTNIWCCYLNRAMAHT